MRCVEHSERGPSRRRSRDVSNVWTWLRNPAQTVIDLWMAVMNSHDDSKRYEANQLFHEAYEAQLANDYERAIELYKRSIETYPTAEAHTFLGWVYSFQERYDDAIQECLEAIRVDDTLGNPYNDIGSYL